jgi:hypothetical protein
MKSQTIRLHKQAIQGTKKLRHNVPIVEAFIVFMVIFLFSGLLMNSSVKVARETLFGKTNRSLIAKDGWSHVQYHGDMLVTKKQFPDYSTPTFRYEYKTDVPLEAFIDVLDHPQQSVEWFAWMVDHKYIVNSRELDTLDLLERTIDFRMVLRPYPSNPFRLHHDREFYIRTKSHIETQVDAPGKETTIATFTYSNIDGQKQECDRCLMAKFDMILTLSSDDEGVSTFINMALNMDVSSDYLPTFLADDMVMRWGALSLHKLVKRCSDDIGLNHRTWFNAKHSLLNVLPIK